MFRKTASILTLAAAGLVAAHAADAAVIDTMDDTTHWDGFGQNVNSDVTANADSTVTVTRPDAAAGSDSGADWGDPSVGNLFIVWSTDVDRLELTPEGPVTASRPDGSSDRYNAKLQFSENGNFLGEAFWVNKTDSADPQIFESVQQLAQDNGYDSFTEYRVRFRIFPTNFDTETDPNPGFTFDDLRAVPEPASLMLMGLGGALVLGRRRK